MVARATRGTGRTLVHPPAVCEDERIQAGVLQTPARAQEGAVLNEWWDEKKECLSQAGLCLLLEPTPAGKEEAWLNPGWAGCQACWSRPALQALVGP